MSAWKVESSRDWPCSFGHLRIEAGLINSCVAGFRVVNKCMDGRTQKAFEEIMLAGHIKWDGCADVEFQPDDKYRKGCLHWCDGADGIRQLGELLNECNREAQELIGTAEHRVDFEP